MITTLTTLMLLAVEPQPEAPARPQAEAPITTAPSASTPSDSAQIDTAAPRGAAPGQPSRIGGALLGSAIGASATMVISAGVFYGLWSLTGQHFCVVFCSPGENNTFTTAFLLGLAIDTVGTLVLVPLGAWLGHRLTGGQGDYGAAVAGSAIALVAGAVVVAAGIAALSSASNDGGRAGASTLIALGLAAPLAGTIIGVELSHNSKLAPHVGLAPAKGGGMLSLAWSL
jgi:hypothetical protein